LPWTLIKKSHSHIKCCSSPHF